MSDGTKIEWTEATWQIITGCSVVSPGCKNCYAMKLAGNRLRNHPSRAGLTQPSAAGPVWTGEVRFNEQWLLQPIAWKRGRRIFVCAHGDLFHEDVPDAWLDRVFGVMLLASQHTFQVLTKRSARMRKYLNADGVRERIILAAGLLTGETSKVDRRSTAKMLDAWNSRPDELWPLRNVWLGISAEDQQRANERVRDLVMSPAAVRWVSAEPLLGNIDLIEAGAIVVGYDDIEPTAERQWGEIDWLVDGGESGHGARPAHPDWFRSLCRQCELAEIAYLHKQNGAFTPTIVTFDEFMHPLPEHVGELVVNPGGRLEGYPLTDAKTFEVMRHVGKKIAGRTLDGVIHDGYPEVRS